MSHTVGDLVICLQTIHYIHHIGKEIEDDWANSGRMVRRATRLQDCLKKFLATPTCHSATLVLDVKTTLLEVLKFVMIAAQDDIDRPNELIAESSVLISRLCSCFQKMMLVQKMTPVDSMGEDPKEWALTVEESIKTLLLAFQEFDESSSSEALLVNALKNLLQNTAGLIEKDLLEILDEMKSLHELTRSHETEDNMHRTFSWIEKSSISSFSSSFRLGCRSTSVSSFRSSSLIMSPVSPATASSFTLSAKEVSISSVFFDLPVVEERISMDPESVLEELREDVDGENCRPATVEWVVKVLDQLKYNSAIVLAALAKLTQLAMFSLHQQTIIEADGAEILLELLRETLDKHPADYDQVFLHVCSILRYICRHLPCQQRLAEMEAMHTLIEVLSCDLTLATQESCLAAIHNLALLPDNHPPLLASGLHVLIASVRSRTESPLLAELGCRTLFWLCDNGRSERVGQTGGILVATHTLATFSSSRTAVEAALRLLRTLANCHQNQGKLAQTQAVTSVLQGLSCCPPDDDSLAVTYLQALQNLAVLPACQAEFLAADGIACVAGRLHTAAGNGKVAEVICKVLRNVSMHEDGEIVVGQADVIPCVVSLLQAHEDLAGVCKSVCGLLATLSCDKSNLQAIIQAEGMEAIVHAMTAHVANAELCTEGFIFLFNAIDLGDIALQRRLLIDCSGLKTLLQALQFNLSHSGLCEWACNVLAGLAMHEGFDETMTDLGGIKMVLQCLQVHSKKKEVLCSGFKFLRVVSAYEERIQERIGSAGGVDLLLRALRSFDGDVTVLEMALGALRMACHCRANKVKFIQLGGIDLVLDIVQRHMSRSSLCELGCSLLRSTAPLAGSIEAMDKRGGAEVLSKILQLHGPQKSAIWEPASESFTMMMTLKRSLSSSMEDFAVKGTPTGDSLDDFHVVDTSGQ